MTAFINKKLEFQMQFFCIFLFGYLCNCVFLYLDFAEPVLFAYNPIFANH